MIKKIKELTCKALVLSMLASTVLPGFSGSAYGAYGEKAAADSEKTEYVLSEIESLLKGSAPYDILIKCTYSDDGTGLSRKEKANKAQRELLELLEQKTKDQSVTEYQSYYIVNAVHAVITSKKLRMWKRSHRTIKLNWSSRSKMTRNLKRHHIQFGIQFLNRMKRTLNGEYPWSTRIKCGTISISMEKALP